jgi:hypothetical protein
MSKIGKKTFLIGQNNISLLIYIMFMHIIGLKWLENESRK